MPLPLKTRPPKAKRLRIVDPTTVLSRPGPQNQMCKSHGGWKLKGFQILDLRVPRSWRFTSRRIPSRSLPCTADRTSLRTSVVRSPAHQCLRAGGALPAQNGPRSAQGRSSLAASGVFLAAQYHVRIRDLRAGSEGGGFMKELVPISSASEVPDSPGDSLAGRGG